MRDPEFLVSRVGRLEEQNRTLTNQVYLLQKQMGWMDERFKGLLEQLQIPPESIEKPGPQLPEFLSGRAA